MFVKIYVVIFIVVITVITYEVYKHVLSIKSYRKRYLINFHNGTFNNTSYTNTFEMNSGKEKIYARKLIKIKEIIKQINLNQKIHNNHFSNLTQFIVIQVDSNVLLLQPLLDSLKTAHSISTALLIFSHNNFSFEINKLVHSIDFASYMQIFYPYYNQWHSNVFPENHNCQNSISCNSGPPTAAQRKNHWWWQVNQVFDNLAVTNNHTNPILFLEEDNYVTVDFLSRTKALADSRRSLDCKIISMGSHKPDELLDSKKGKTLERRDNKMSTIGIAFDREVWRSIKARSHDFCYFNDYTWDNTLKYIASTHGDINFCLVTIHGPRVLGIEKCDTKNISCKAEDKIEEVEKFVEVIDKDLLPEVLLIKVLKNDSCIVNPLGNFSDDRDHELCMFFSNNNVWY